MRRFTIIALLCFAGLGSEIAALECHYYFHSVLKDDPTTRMKTCPLGEVCMTQFTKLTIDNADLDVYSDCAQVSAQTTMGCFVSKNSQVTCYCNTEQCNMEHMFPLREVEELISSAHRPMTSWLLFVAMVFVLLHVVLSKAL
ncbi:uncharacterized protein LOC129588833 isoform X2 [Paramacrobiotus metropolitanus]|uniref:uncharacterized protein LOC129588833 isoform X2 n=1 Tax=Paramacrobiotus metropolitanus TaxID=2943436 RepID=UPI0024461349|nr:uncharacterized protein LOC129588833 isoform X2 [Paramacrobiotus metropolitanus]